MSIWTVNPVVLHRASKTVDCGKSGTSDKNKNYPCRDMLLSESALKGLLHGGTANRMHNAEEVTYWLIE